MLKLLSVLHTSSSVSIVDLRHKIDVLAGLCGALISSDVTHTEKPQHISVYEAFEDILKAAQLISRGATKFWICVNCEKK